MHPTTHTRWSILALALAVLCADALAVEMTLPEDRGVRYSIREVPTDPNSAVRWTVDLSLEAVDRCGNDVGWAITRVTITDLDSIGNVDRTWTELAPGLATPDGLWWVSHADLEAIESGEFDVLPALGGFAQPTLGTSTTLSYSLAGAVYTPEPGDPLFGHTVSGLTYAFMLEGSSTPEEEGEDEPAEIEEPTPPAYPSG
jgi:hypothetical protein